MGEVKGHGNAGGMHVHVERVKLSCKQPEKQDKIGKGKKRFGYSKKSSNNCRETETKRKKT